MGVPPPLQTAMEAQGFLGLVVFECALLAFLQKSNECLSNFHARKICHAGTGLLLLQLDSRQEEARWFVYMIGVGSLAMTWEIHPRLKPFRFGKSRDIGISAYLIVAMLWFRLQLPIRVLAPMFFADPAGAVVGKFLSGLKDQGFVNPVWWSKGGTTKTIGGSMAVLVFTILTFAGPASLTERLIIGILAVLAEAIGGAFDNLLLVGVVVGARLLLNFLHFGSPSLEYGRPPIGSGFVNPFSGLLS